MSYLKPGLYVGVFALAYGIFVYHNYSTEQNQPADRPLATAGHSDAGTRRDTSAEQFAQAQSSYSAVYAYTEAYLEDGRQHNTDTFSGQDGVASRPRQQAESSVTDTRDDAHASPAVAGIFGLNPGAENTANNTPGDTSPDNTAASGATEPSDIPGYEFLPDGKSQEDVAANSSGQPRSYSIAQYQKADISCEPGYGAGPEKQGLLLQLKGC